MFQRIVAVTLALTPVSAGAEPPLVVEIVTARAVSETQSYSLTGEIRARDTLSAAFPTGGRISEITVEAGAEVTKGTVLAQIESVQQEQALRAAEAGLRTADADYRQAHEDLDRQDALLERGATTRIARDSAEDALGIAEGVLGQARAELRRTQKAVDDTVLRAPKDATVTDRLADPGQIVGAAQPVLELALGTGIDAVFEVPEVMMTLDYDPTQIDLSLIDRPDARFTGYVEEISPVVDPITGAVSVRVAVTDPPRGLTFGEVVRGSAERATAAQIILPYSAISATATGPAVWKVDPDKMTVTPIPVVIDRYETGRILIASGIEDGTMIVGKGTQLLYPGRVVRAVEATE